ncbi:MAG: DNA recombination protein RmuC, partial [Spirochaetes bacterium]|nr:DNA recombination protein RmuC [Spirochaetota bacterium]
MIITWSQIYISILAFIIIIITFLLVYLILKDRFFNKNTYQGQILQQEFENLKKMIDNSSMQTKVEFNQRLDFISKQINNNAQNSFQVLQNQFKHTTQIIKEISHQLASLDDTNQQVLSFSKQLQSLENILKNPKQRGILGEYFLESILKNILPPHLFKMQYKYNDGKIVDAVIFFQDKIIPVDAKFSLAKYEQIQNESNPEVRQKLTKGFRLDIKKRIDEVAVYVRPHEDTT